MRAGSAEDLSFGVKSNCVVALRRPHAGSGVSFAVQLPLHEEVALLLEVEVAVSTHEALGMPVLVPRLHNGTDYATPTFVTEWHPLCAAGTAMDFSNWSSHTPSSSRTVIGAVVN